MNKVEGLIVSVLKSSAHGYPTYPQDSVDVGPLGIEGDAHSGPFRESFTKPGTQKPNDRPISIVSWDVVEAANREFGLQMKPGDFNEQLLVKGLDDLGWIAIGSIITFAESQVRLEVVDYAYPCIKLAEHTGNSELIDYLVTLEKRNLNGKPYSKRGVLAKVLDVGELKAGDSIFVEDNFLQGN